MAFPSKLKKWCEASAPWRFLELVPDRAGRWYAKAHDMRQPRTAEVVSFARARSPDAALRELARVLPVQEQRPPGRPKKKKATKKATKKVTKKKARKR